ncbi:phosphatase PAP2 family protein [Paracoccus halophilus]|uniref:phosphatase PAP2 family protein n=1 Tax=Paracoccus halophilus TaxID=376733 RepID=UPI00068BABFB|nr:phosphatase PAP2 family protein [Paracoccus halophilus]
MLLAQALNIAREGIIDPEATGSKTPHREPLSPAKRLGRIEFAFAQSVLLSEMLDSLTIAPEPDQNPLSHIKVLARDGGNETTILKLNQPSDGDFAEELKLILGYATLRPERLPEIEVQTADLISFYASILPIQPARAKMINYLLELGLNLATAIVQRVKLAFDAPRPDVLSDQVQPMIDMPLHGSYPSGHATQAFTLAMLLTILTRKREAHSARIKPDSQLFRMAARIAANRTVAGVHFPSDSVSGALLGITLARWIAIRAGAVNQDCPSYDFDARLWGDQAPGGNRDFYLARLCDVLNDGHPCLQIGAAVTGPVSPVVKGVWDMAREEWGQRWS